MAFIKLAIISFVFFFLLITGISLFIPSNVRISRALTIDASREVVMEKIKDPSQWKAWYPMVDSLGTVRIEGEVKGIRTSRDQSILIDEVTDSTVGAIQGGVGSKKIRMGWQVMPGESKGKSTVQWYMDFHLRWYPWEKFSSLFFEKQYGTPMEQGLNRLKKIVENN